MDTCLGRSHTPRYYGPNRSGSRAGTSPRPQPRRIYSPGLHRVSQLVQHPDLLTFREACLLALGAYALYRFCFTAPVVGSLLRVIVALLWSTVCVLGSWAGEVAPWAILGVAVVFVKEKVLGYE